MPESERPSGLPTEWEADFTAEQLIPLRRSGLVPQRLRFNLDDVHARALDPSMAALAANATDYVFSPDEEALLEVGPSGLDLLKACSGQYLLREILDAVGDGNRDETLRFFRDLEQRRFLSWVSEPCESR
jgi:hypothetical protein